VGRLTVLYDADCGLCTAVVLRLRSVDSERLLDLVPLQRAQEKGGQAAELARREDLTRAIHVVDDAGDWAAGGEAALRIMERVPSLRPFARLARLPGLHLFVEPCYRLVARNRSRIGASFGKACRIPPDRVRHS
jgi:predicted DCC family thiol-disulfide oxidoreductase YuxK